MKRQKGEKFPNTSITKTLENYCKKKIGTRVPIIFTISKSGISEIKCNDCKKNYVGQTRNVLKLIPKSL